MKMISFYQFFLILEHRWNEIDRENWSTRGTPVPVLLCPPQIPHGLARGRTRASAGRDQRLTAWAITGQRRHLLTKLRSNVSQKTVTSVNTPNLSNKISRCLTDIFKLSGIQVMSSHFQKLISFISLDNRGMCRLLRCCVWWRFKRRLLRAPKDFLYCHVTWPLG
jgi:hypothetical protein